MVDSASQVDRQAEGAPERKPPPRPRPPDEHPPLFGGRLWIAIAMLVLLAIISNPKVNSTVVRAFGPKVEAARVVPWRVGKEAEVSVTVITADFHRLACGHDQEIEGLHCGFRNDGRMWERKPGLPVDDNTPEVIQPYRTPDNRLILLAGLWAQPALAMRLHREPPRAAPVKRLVRFDASCRVKFIGQFDPVRVRWDVGTPWQTERSALVARPLSCKILGE